MERLVSCFSNGMAFGMSVGSRRANRIIDGKISSKNMFDSVSSIFWKSSCNATNFHTFAYFGLYVNIASSNSSIDLIGFDNTDSITVHRCFSCNEIVKKNH